MIDRKPKQADSASQDAVDQFLADGGKITYCAPGERTENLEVKGGFYGRKPKKKEDE